MTRTYLLLLVALSIACGDDSCPPGEMLIGAACIASAVDGGAPVVDSGVPTEEVCNGLDDDRDGEVDEADPELGASCSEDVGACTAGTLTCVEGALVCDGVLPADEVCNAIDDDCDGDVDELVQFTFYLDEDGDTFGGDVTCDVCAMEECGEGNWVAVGGDCDDTCETCFEGGTEVCDTLDNDCDGETDEDDVQIFIYPDADGDGFGTGEGVAQCETSAGFADAGGDCADGDARAFPGATEYYETPIMGETTGAPFDYDCDGEEFKEHVPCGTGCRNGFCYNVINDECGEGNLLREVQILLDRCTVPSGSPQTAGTVRCR
jgi:hypothetical protein